LSCVWGQTQQATLDNPGAIRNVPATIQDAIDSTSAIGYHYVRVDAVCVSSDSHDARMSDIKTMDEIYSNDGAVLKAAAIANASYGLRGVSEMAQPYKSFRIPETVVHCRRPDDVLLDQSAGR
jgi:Heterokaryon incompatibility protein (HET)